MSAMRICRVVIRSARKHPLRWLGALYLPVIAELWGPLILELTLLAALHLISVIIYPALAYAFGVVVMFSCYVLLRKCTIHEAWRRAAFLSLVSLPVGVVIALSFLSMWNVDPQSLGPVIATAALYLTSVDESEPLVATAEAFGYRYGMLT